MRKKILFILSAVLSVGVFASCGYNKTEKTVEVKETKEIKVVIPDGLPSIAMARLIKEKPEISKGYKISYSIEKTPETLVTSVLKGEPDIAIVPSNVAATAYNKTGKYKIAATTGFGSFYLVSTKDVKDIKDIKGKTVANIGRGLTPDIITKTILKESGLNVDKDVKFDYFNAVTELVPALLSGKESLAVLPEPALSTALAKNPKISIIANLNDNWKKINGSEFGFPQATIIVKTDIIEKDEFFFKKFLNNVGYSISWAYDNQSKLLGEYCEEIGVSVNKEILEKAMEKSNIKYADIRDTKNEYIDYFKRLNDFDNKTIGGKIPDEGIFME